VRAVNCLLKEERCETLIGPIATLAYYAAAHCFEACFADGVGVPPNTHCGTHEDRINAALRKRDVHGAQATNGLSTPYQFSRVARYCQDKPPHGMRRSGSRALVVKHLGQDPRSARELLVCLDTIVEKVRSMLGVAEHDLPRLAIPSRLSGSVP
jgi:hypothetical protein